MKYLLSFGLSLIFFVAAISQTDQKYERVDEASLDPNKVEFATKLANEILLAQKGGGFYALTKEEATEQMVSGLNENVQKQSYQQLKLLFGDFKEMSFDHMMKTPDENSYEIYRFKGQFEASVTEIRVVLSPDQKLAGFFVKPWSDNL